MSYIGNKPANKAIVASDLDPAVITGQTALAVAPADTDEFLISDAGVLKRLDASLIGGGKVLQVVNATDSSARDTTSTSFVTASNTLSVNITPSSSSSKIFIIYSTAIYMDSNNNRIYTTLYRDSTNLGDSSRGLNSLLIGDNDLCVPCSHSILDSPSTASQVTYQVYMRVSGSTGYFNTDGAGPSVGSITVFEIGA